MIDTSTKRVLLMHISNVSGHLCASLAIKKALEETEGDVQITNIETLNYTNPLLGRLVNVLYLIVIKTIPQLWEYLYDNEGVVRKLKKIRSLMHRLKDKKIKKIFDDFNPNIIVCTQAFPCGMIADYKRRHNLEIPLLGVLTDFAPHSYWLNDCVNTYIVPTPEIKKSLTCRGIQEERLEVLGIPIDSKFGHKTDQEETFRRLGLDASVPVILIMGGGQGLGPIKEIALALDKVPQRIQLIVVCGRNKGLYRWLMKRKKKFSKPIAVIGYTEHIDHLMDISSFIVSKPGGLTSAEALSKGLPIIIVNPLPGQESRNASFLLERGVALKAGSTLELRSLTEKLLSELPKLTELRNRAKSLARADSSLKIALVILKTIAKQQN